MLHASSITITDQFCGAGGSSLGAVEAGAEIKLAINHWDVAIQTHQANHPYADHDCTDIQACNPRRYPSTTILLSSPECTNHSISRGRKRQTRQLSFLDPQQADPSAERSRATMWDVVRFAEVHRYQAIIVENVPDVRHWILYDEWLKAMHKLGYRHQEVHVNSMFFHPTPQSRDRIYIVFWRATNHAPHLDYRPKAWCEQCHAVIHAIQSWKTPTKPYGRYKQQYVYRCPSCATIVTPYYHCALNAIDWTLPVQRIGERQRPLKAKTLDRIQAGLDKYRNDPLQINVTQGIDQVRSLTAPLFTQMATEKFALAFPPALIMANYTPGWCKPLTATIGTVTTQDHHSLVLLPASASTIQQDQTTPWLLGSDIPQWLHKSSFHEAIGNQQGHIAIEECGFRMLHPREIARAMAFPTGYIVHGTQRDQIRQYGNAVTPPPMKWLVSQLIATLG